MDVNVVETRGKFNRGLQSARQNKQPENPQTSSNDDPTKI